MRNSTTGNDLAGNKMHTHNHSIKCNVDTCYYYDNNYCSAGEIQVSPQGDGVAHSTDGTACTTFVESTQ
ncbi:MAG TPA: DUF1540 domain-containing protein [Bacillota bacterium]|nr:DUF1540 domain-containing protein [Bacillota bacterium]HOR85457.1 DUF1540 domain-containing protein [Bacillota bacterium]HPL52849.1 DUF1540 domain-containing protein [Bacillota bacterium]